MKNISVIGSGQMGNGIAHVFAQNGFKVTMIDIRQEALDKAIQTISANLDRQVAKALITEDVKQQTLANIKINVSLKEGVAAAVMAINVQPKGPERKANAVDAPVYATKGRVTPKNPAILQMTVLIVV